MTRVSRPGDLTADLRRVTGVRRTRGHTVDVTTLAELERRGLRVVGTVMNGIEPEGSSEFAHAVATHRETLARFTKVADLGELPHAPEAELGALGGKLDLAAIALAMGI